MELQVYVDTNVYLRLLGGQPTVSDDMSKFLALCQNASIELLLPEQTIEEYLSNREDVVARAIGELKSAASVGGFPPLVQNHELGDEASHLRKQLAAKLRTIERWYAEAAKKRELPFDGWFEQLQSVATKLKSEADVIVRAQQRAAMHMPPGKGEALGDRLIWECLVKAGDLGADLHLITTDKDDFRCPLNAGAIRSRLQKEWADVNWGNITLSDNIAEFLRDVGQSENFQRAADTGRAIWSLSHLSDDVAIAVASDTIEREMTCLSLRQVKLIARASRAYFDRVFMTVGKFDRMIAQFYRHYAKHLSKAEEENLRPVVAATEELGSFIAANNNQAAA